MTLPALESPSAPASPTASATPTIWGLTARELHDAFWSRHGVQCVRPGDPTSLDRSADFYLLLEPEQLALFELRELLERLIWSGAVITRLRITRADNAHYEERIVAEGGLVQRIERRYGPDLRASARVFLTRRIRIAEQWSRATSPRAGWKSIRSSLRGQRIDSIRVNGGWSGTDSPREHERALREIVARWKDPDRAIEGIEEISEGIWQIRGEAKSVGPTVVGPAWLGCGEAPEEDEFIIGPAYYPDRLNGTDEAPRVVRVRGIFDIVSGDAPKPVARETGNLYPFFKRTFDIAASATALVALSPLLLLVSLAILLDGGRPVFFGHRRQTRGGAEFSCLKFRTMCRNAETLVGGLAGENRCDGPQVFIPDDPRVTRVGRFLRATNLDELPQLWNVLLGHMSIVGPRPSPEKENRCCPAWRDMRLSVRPGITGLWQVNRTRAEGEDFQEWIRYDIEYVKRANFWLDLLICFQTVRVLLLGRKP